MQSACLELERQFSRCSSDLDVIAKQLESDFDSEKTYSRNPMKILQRVQALKDDLPKVQEDWKRIMVAKQTLIDIATSQQLATHRTLKQMTQAANLSVSEDEHERPFDEFRAISQEWDKENSSQVASIREGLLGHMLLTPEELNMEVLKAACEDAHYAEEEEQQPDVASSQKDGQMQEEDNAKQETEVEKPPAHTISPEEFISVSNIVRGRCKLEECNELLGIIMSKSRRSKGGVMQPISTAELVKMGARVTGQTGGSRLATLRSLKRITVSKEGVLVNPKYLHK